MRCTGQRCAKSVHRGLGKHFSLEWLKNTSAPVSRRFIVAPLGEATMTMDRRFLLTAAGIVATTTATVRWRAASAQGSATSPGKRGGLEYRSVEELRAML